MTLISQKRLRDSNRSQGRLGPRISFDGIFYYFHPMGTQNQAEVG